ncbi:hypothetical protein ACHAXA_003440 [Cyclostephanos tholiformis]|uniref:Prenyltransferase alpha-alpha toroid domain-containing protein n=1 Tax=Cyclostephanos tholiformis TaxID=382380 RepID=A0ABD3SFH8_9STRA
MSSARGPSPPPQRRSKHAHATATTLAQETTEEEVSPFLDVDLSSLPMIQLDRLRRVGLIPPPSSPFPSHPNSHPSSSSSSSSSSPPLDDDAEYDYDPYAIRLLRNAHVAYLRGALSDALPRGFVSLDASRPWMVYWCLHSLDLLGYFDDVDDDDDDVVVVVDDDDDDDEMDDDIAIGRGVEEMERADLLRRIVSTLRTCWTDAHGGYAFCAIASLRLLLHCNGGGRSRRVQRGRLLEDLIDVDALSSWLARRQMGYEGGFSGRTNKLVDGCYSFWQGGATAVLDGYLGEGCDDNCDDDDCDNDNYGMHSSRRSPAFDEWMLQRYILLCAQDVNGGLRDKPSKSRDFYHSCYNLSGLSVAQHAIEPWPPTSKANGRVREDDDCGDEEYKEKIKKEEERLNMGYNRLFGDASVNIVGRTDPVINIRVERVRFMLSRQF